MGGQQAKATASSGMIDKTAADASTAPILCGNNDFSPFVLPHERVDDLQINGLFLIQDPAQFCFGTDAVLLANFAVAKKNEKVLDLCTGTGVVPILMTAKTPARFWGLEIQTAMADMARRSVAMNGLSGRVVIDCGDIKEAAALYGTAAFDVVTVNPPYLNAGEKNESAPIAMARHEVACTLEDVVAAAAKMLRFGGRLYMVYRPHRLADVICALRAVKLEPKRLRFVGGKADENKAELVLVEATLGGRVWMTVEAGV